MRAMAVICGTKQSNFSLDDINMQIDLIDIPYQEPRLDKGQILIQVKAFSCNYRDKWLIKQAHESGRQGYYIFGSEFCGNVIGIGSEVSNVDIGDLVISNHHYGFYNGKRLNGIPTNHSSKEFLVVEHDKVLKIDSNIDPTIGAAISLGGQTSRSMIRRSGIGPNNNALVMAPTSNTSIFIIQQLVAMGVDVSVLGSNQSNSSRVLDLGVTKYYENTKDGREALMSSAMKKLGFDYAFDVFSDIYGPSIFPFLTLGATYITCGVLKQGYFNGNINTGGISFADASQLMIQGNLNIVANCLGVRGDLEEFVGMVIDQSISPIIDSVHTLSSPTEFLFRTYVDRTRFGKVVYAY